MGRAAPPAFDTFSFTYRTIVDRRVRLGYALSGKDGTRVTFEETLDIPETLGKLAAPDDPAVSRALFGLHLAAGTSYWKTFIPRDLIVDTGALSAEDAQFWGEVYTLGMGEFYYRNGIDPRGRATFRATAEASERPAKRSTPTAPTLVLWGGGKDSVVSHEILREAEEPHELLSIGRADWEWVRRSAEAGGGTLHVIPRRLDPKLAELSATGALNGHVPVNAILAFSGLLAAALAGRPGVIASNESSASEGNVVWHGIDVNHQWSKSLAFERLMREWMKRHLGDGFEYVSLLRPLTELRIVKAFATHPLYFGAVTSCNANFKQEGSAARRFCLTCPKCVFVALMARPWLDDAAYHALFSGDPLSDPSNVTLVEELLGVRGSKPFECVGTPDETIAAIHLARSRRRTIPHGVMTAFAASRAADGADLDALAEKALERADQHELSERRLRQLDDYLARH